jgi:hypothetical protein
MKRTLVKEKVLYFPKKLTLSLQTIHEENTPTTEINVSATLQHEKEGIKTQELKCAIADSLEV